MGGTIILMTRLADMQATKVHGACLFQASFTVEVWFCFGSSFCYQDFQSQGFDNEGK